MDAISERQNVTPLHRSQSNTTAECPPWWVDLPCSVCRKPIGADGVPLTMTLAICGVHAPFVRDALDAWMGLQCQ